MPFRRKTEKGKIRTIESFKQFATEQKFTMTFAKLGAFQLTMKTVNAFVFFFYFPSGPLSFVYMQVPSSQERASKNFERTPLCLARFCPEVNSRKALFP